ncbi:MAG TPA: R3H domain-containing nucleic acid-binding protein [Thermoanaerobaculia bacterium]|nr:R3H domain-containing nucleic acid-binding protein [Thermoanaerobaculia bacterium]
MQRFEGKNVEEALNHAAETFGVERYKLRHAVLTEKRGFLGGVKRVIIEAEVNENATEPPPQPVAAVAEAGPAAPPRRERGPRGAGGGRSGNRAGSSRDSRPARGGRRRRREYDDEDADRDSLQPGDFAQFADAIEIPEQGPESETAGAVRTWCEQVLSLAKLNLAVRTEENDTQVHVRLYGSDGRRMIDRNGELLDAVQVLANKSLTGRRVEKDIELDCENFKGRRVEDLEQRAHEIADRVREDGREFLLPAMSPIERRIVHMTLRDDADVTTESRGEGFFKRVAIIRRAASES